MRAGTGVVAGRGVREKVRSLLKALNSTEETAAQLVALHVRRGDSADGSLNYWCNSTVPAVLGYLACPAVASHLKAFVEGLPGYPSTPARLVLVTDEKDASYLNELIGKLIEMPLWRGSAAGVTHGLAAAHRSLRLLSPPCLGLPDAPRTTLCGGDAWWPAPCSRLPRSHACA